MEIIGNGVKLCMTIMGMKMLVMYEQIHTFSYIKRLCVHSIPLCYWPCTEVVYCLLSRKNRLRNPADTCDQVRDMWVTVKEGDKDKDPHT